MAGRAFWHVGMASVLLVGPWLAFADGPGMLDQLHQAFAGAKVTLLQAVEAAQKEVAGGQVVDAELKWNRTPVYFEVELFAGDRLTEVRIDVLSGQVLGVEGRKLGESEVAAFADVKQLLAGAKLAVGQAIAAATKEVKDGQPLALALEGEGYAPVYGVKVLQGDKLRNARIDAVSGGVLKIVDEPLPLALWTFDAAEAGKPAAGLLARETHPSGKPGQWQVAADPIAPSKPNVLTLTTSAPNATFNVALFEKTSYQDLDLRVRVRANSGKDDQGGGLVWRGKDENNYYTCRINPLENNFRVYKVVDGKRSQLQSTEFKTRTGRWYQVQAVMVGDHITCSVDGRKYLEAQDNAFKDAGLIGLWTKADASSSFDNLAVFAPSAEQTKAATEKPGQKKGEKAEKDDDD